MNRSIEQVLLAKIWLTDWCLTCFLVHHPVFFSFSHNLQLSTLIEAASCVWFWVSHWFSVDFSGWNNLFFRCSGNCPQCFFAFSNFVWCCDSLRYLMLINKIAPFFWNLLCLHTSIHEDEFSFSQEHCEVLVYLSWKRVGTQRVSARPKDVAQIYLYP